MYILLQYLNSLYPLFGIFFEIYDTTNINIDFLN